MFYIVHVSDFHFGARDYSPDDELKILNKYAEYILGKVKESAKIYFCACGDYIDSRPDSSGKKLLDTEVEKRYFAAENAITSFVNFIRDSGHECDIFLCPGNHDITHKSQMNAFSQKLMGEDIDKCYSKHIDSENVDFIFVNSCASEDYKKGEIDYKQLENILKELDTSSAKYIFLHHTIMSMDDEDSSSIRHAPALIKMIDEYSVRAVFHGHTHGQYLCHIGKTRCPIIGVGAALSRNNPNVNSQFNLIECNYGYIASAINCKFCADTAEMPHDGFADSAFNLSEDNNVFCSSKFSGTYEDVVNCVKARGVLYNMHINCKSSYDDFKNDIIDSIGKKQEISSIDKIYSYEDLAKMWEKEDCDDALYFNHGTFFSSEQYRPGIKYVVDELKRKRTSNRALLSTINSPLVSNSCSDGNLPSLLSIQFGFDTDDPKMLFITMNLRALEVSRFLKINICEILYLAEQVHREIDFNSINLNIMAFRVQYKEKFGCFLKAALDKYDSADFVKDLSVLIYSDNKDAIKEQISSIIEMVKDKKTRSETVVVTTGAESLHHALKKIKGDNKCSDDYKKRIEQLDNEIIALLEKMNDLKKERLRKSVQNAEIDSIEKEINCSYNSIIEQLEGLTE